MCVMIRHVGTSEREHLPSSRRIPMGAASSIPRLYGMCLLVMPVEMCLAGNYLPRFVALACALFNRDRCLCLFAGGDPNFDHLDGIRSFGFERRTRRRRGRGGEFSIRQVSMECRYVSASRAKLKGATTMNAPPPPIPTILPPQYVLADVT